MSPRVIVARCALALSIPIALAFTPAFASPSDDLAIGLDEHLGATIPRDLPFTDSEGRQVTLAPFINTGRPIVLVMAYARCRMLCSVVLHGFADAVHNSKLVPGRDYLPIVVSLDPRETVGEARRRQDTLLDNIGRANDREAWPYLLGPDTSIHALAEALGFRYAWDPRTEQYAHPAVVFVLSPGGRIAEYLRGVAFDSLDEAVRRAAQGLTTQSSARDLLRCFHFDPVLRKYEARIQLAFRVGAAAVFMCLLSALLGLFYWERRRQR